MFIGLVMLESVNICGYKHVCPCKKHIVNSSLFHWLLITYHVCAWRPVPVTPDRWHFWSQTLETTCLWNIQNNSVSIWFNSKLWICDLVFFFFYSILEHELYNVVSKLKEQYVTGISAFLFHITTGSHSVHNLSHVH